VGFESNVRRLFALAAVGAVAGCSLFGLDGLSGGDDSADGGAPKGDAPWGDAPFSSTDGGGGGDGGGDSGPSGPFCKTVGAGAAVCDDFEEPGTFTGRWPEQDQYLGTLEVKDGIGYAGTRGLRFNAMPVPDGQNARAILGWVTPSAASYVDCEIAVKLSEIPPSGYLAGPIYVQMDELNGGYARFGFGLDGARVVTTSPILFPADAEAISSGSKAVTTLTIGVWTRLRLVVDLGKSPPALYAYVDGALELEQSLHVGFQPAKVAVRAGAYFAGTGAPGGAIAMDLDDARVSWK
jgi:hypothetical protein